MKERQIRNVSEFHDDRKLWASILIDPRFPTKNLLAGPELGKDDHRKM